MTLQQSRRLQSLLLGTLAWAVAILIFFPRANKAELGVFDLQNRPPRRSARLLGNYSIARVRLGRDR